MKHKLVAGAVTLALAASLLLPALALADAESCNSDPRTPGTGIHWDEWIEAGHTSPNNYRVTAMSGDLLEEEPYIHWSVGYSGSSSSWVMLDDGSGHYAQIGHLRYRNPTFGFYVQEDFIEVGYDFGGTTYDLYFNPTPVGTLDTYAVKWRIVGGVNHFYFYRDSTLEVDYSGSAGQGWQPIRGIASGETHDYADQMAGGTNAHQGPINLWYEFYFIVGAKWYQFGTQSTARTVAIVPSAYAWYGQLYHVSTGSSDSSYLQTWDLFCPN